MEDIGLMSHKGWMTWLNLSRKLSNQQKLSSVMGLTPQVTLSRGRAVGMCPTRSTRNLHSSTVPVMRLRTLPVTGLVRTWKTALH